MRARGTRARGWLGFAAVCAALAGLSIAGALAIAMVLRGKWTRTEAIHYALFSRYPMTWFRK